MALNNPLVSVIMPAYNHDRFIEEAIHSIVEQTYKNIELIVIDDGSTDGTYKKLLLLELQCKNRFKWVDFSTQKNCGISETLNKLVTKAKGEFMFFMASDDVAKPQAIEKLVMFMATHDDYVLAVGDNEFINENSKVIGWNKYRDCADINDAQYKTFGSYLMHVRRDVDFFSEQFGKYETFLKSNYIPNGIMARRSGLQCISKFTSDAPLEDWFLHLQLSKLGMYKFLNQVLFSYRIHSDNTSANRKLMHEYRTKTRLYEWALIQQKGYEKWKKIFDDYFTIREDKLRIGKFIHFYKLVDYTYKSYILEVCGHPFNVKRKKRKSNAMLPMDR